MKTSYENWLNRFPVILDVVYAHSLFRMIPSAVQLCAALMYAVANTITSGRYVYHYVNCICWIQRVGSFAWCDKILRSHIKSWARRIQENPSSFIASYQRSRRAHKIRLLVQGEDKNLRFLRENCIVLKSRTPREKGVILIKYAEAIEGFALLGNLPMLQKSYHLVLEMSWEGVCDPTYFLYLNRGDPVFIEATSRKDHQILEELNTNLIPLKIAANDWIDTDSSLPAIGLEKIYDVTMVANWGVLKNHRKLFRSLERMSIPDSLRVLLIGFPWRNRSKEHVIAEYVKYVKKNASRIQLIIKERIPHSDVIRALAQSKTLVLLTHKEGCNQAIAESLVCNTPVVCYDRIKGGALEKVTPQTGIRTPFRRLHHALSHMVNNYRRFEPRKFYMENSGASHSLALLEHIIRLHSHEAWSVKLEPIVNAHGLRYRYPEHASKYVADYRTIHTWLGLPDSKFELIGVQNTENGSQRPLVTTEIQPLIRASHD